ncbi:hypothetical protein ScPMuIL_001197 [Solemya velum]
MSSVDLDVWGEEWVDQALLNELIQLIGHGGREQVLEGVNTSTTTTTSAREPNGTPKFLSEGAAIRPKVYSPDPFEQMGPGFEKQIEMH